MNKENKEDIIGYYALSNNNTILIYKIDYAEDKVLVSLNGKHIKWCDIKLAPGEEGALEQGFYFWGEDDTFIPFLQVMKARI